MTTEPTNKQIRDCLVEQGYEVKLGSDRCIVSDPHDEDGFHLVCETFTEAMRECARHFDIRVRGDF